jgi:hypothetical protein
LYLDGCMRRGHAASRRTGPIAPRARLAEKAQHRRPCPIHLSLGDDP